MASLMKEIDPTRYCVVADELGYLLYEWKKKLRRTNHETSADIPTNQ